MTLYQQAKQNRIEYKLKLKKEKDPDIRALIEKKIQTYEDCIKYLRTPQTTKYDYPLTEQPRLI
jgi:hypothetical protein